MPKVAITGKTYPVKDRLKEIGARWNAEGKVWEIEANKLPEAQAIVDAGPQPEPPVADDQIPF